MRKLLSKIDALAARCDNFVFGMFVGGIAGVIAHAYTTGTLFA